jgi:hypothetical protein
MLVIIEMVGNMVMQVANIAQVTSWNMLVHLNHTAKESFEAKTREQDKSDRSFIYSEVVVWT